MKANIPRKADTFLLDLAMFISSTKSPWVLKPSRALFLARSSINSFRILEFSYRWRNEKGSRFSCCANHFLAQKLVFWCLIWPINKQNYCSLQMYMAVLNGGGKKKKIRIQYFKTLLPNFWQWKNLEKTPPMKKHYILEKYSGLPKVFNPLESHDSSLEYYICTIFSNICLEISFVPIYFQMQK